MKAKKKSQIWISAIIYTLVAVVALVLILNTGLPILNEMKDRSVFTKIKDVMQDLDSHITEIARQGEGSQATVSFEIGEGEINFIDNQIVWEIETKSKVISPRSSTSIGNLIISSNANVRTYELENAFLLNTTLRDDSFAVKINKIGSEASPVLYNTSQIIEYIDYNGNKMDGNFTFSLNGNASSSQGYGYTKMIPSGNNTNLGRAIIIAHMDSDFAAYDLEMTLESYADFLTVKLKNVQPK